ncbi:MAG: Gfo/Idh/MocA family protein [Planctomycetota bacterium]|jgi:predicted dehydrogenase
MSAEKKTLKMGIIGAGGRGINSFATLMSQEDNCEVVAFCDPNPVRMKAASEQIEGEQNHYTNITEMLKKEDLDGVVVASPDFAHESNAVECLENGIHVLIDKPLAKNVKECKNIIAAAEKSGMIIMMGFNLRHHPTLVRTKEIIEEGTLGRIFMIENREFYDGGRTYMGRWNRFYDKSGGLWNHKGSHDFDVFNWLLDFPKPVKVSAIAGVSVLNPDNLPFEVKDGVEPGPTCSKCPYNDTCKDASPHVESKLFTDETEEVDSYAKDVCIYLSEKDTHDSGIALVEYEGGIKASHLECFVTSHSDRLYTICGTKGQAEVSLHDRTIKIRPRWSQEIIDIQMPEPTGGHGGADPGLVQSFLKAVRGEIENNSTCEQGMISTSIAEAAELAWREERTVKIEELMK